jgi:hypothetical protein
VDTITDKLLRKSDRAGNRTRDLYICSQELCPLDHRSAQCAVYQGRDIDRRTDVGFEVLTAVGTSLRTGVLLGLVFRPEMEATSCSETSVHSQLNTRLYIPEDGTLYQILECLAVIGSVLVRGTEQKI